MIKLNLILLCFVIAMQPFDAFANLNKSQIDEHLKKCDLLWDEFQAGTRCRVNCSSDETCKDSCPKSELLLHGCSWNHRGLMSRVRLNPKKAKQGIIDAQNRLKQIPIDDANNDDGLLFFAWIAAFAAEAFIFLFFYPFLSRPNTTSTVGTMFTLLMAMLFMGFLALSIMLNTFIFYGFLAEFFGIPSVTTVIVSSLINVFIVGYIWYKSKLLYVEAALIPKGWD